MKKTNGVVDLGKTRAKKESDEMLSKFKDRTEQKVLSKEQDKILAEQIRVADQQLVIRLEFFKTNAERRAFCEAIGCPFGQYMELKQKYRKAISIMNKYNPEQKRHFLLARGFDPDVLLYKKKY